MDSALDGAARVRAAGPLFESQSSTSRLFRAFRPFYSERSEPLGERTSRYYLWPVASHTEAYDESSWRFLLLFGHDFDRDEPGSRYKLFLLPFFFAGRDAGREPYAALFPLGGVIREFLGQDRIAFFLFPLYCHTRVNQTDSWHVLWPVFSRTEGPGVRRWSVFPLYGESEQEGKWLKRYVMWPVWTQADYYYSNASGRAWMVWPLVGRVAVSDQSSWMVFPPLFRWSRTDDRTAYYGPWPFIEYGSGARDRLHLWPLWGRSREPDEYRGFALWPIVRWGGLRRGKEESNWVQVAPLLYYETRSVASTNTAGGPLATRARLWPLFSYVREGDGSRLRIAELWPLPTTAGVEQGWAPLWTLYQRSRWGGAEEDEFLWGLFRRRKGPEGWSMSLFPLFSIEGGADGRTGEWRLLEGLLGRRRGASGSAVRYLYFFTAGDAAAGGRAG
jgi:hypothetical protein